MNWYKIANIEFSPEYRYGQYMRFDIMLGNTSIGHVSYRYEDGVIYIDMIQIIDQTQRRKGYASQAIKYLMNKYNTNIVKPTEDGFTDEGKDLFDSLGLI